MTFLRSSGAAFRRLFWEIPTPERAQVSLTLLFDLGSQMSENGTTALERHIEQPQRSPIFQRHHGAMALSWLIGPLIDTLRLRTCGCDDAVLDRVWDRHIVAQRQEIDAILRRVAHLPLMLTGLWLAVAALVGPAATTTSAASWGLALALLVLAGRLVRDHGATLAAERLSMLEGMRLAFSVARPAQAVDAARLAFVLRIRPTFSQLEARLLEDSVQFSPAPAASDQEPDDIAAMLRETTDILQSLQREAEVSQPAR